MSSTVELKFDISTTDPAVPLGVEVWLDSDKILDVNHVVADIPFLHTISDQPAERELKIILKNKTHEHTKVDGQGTIISDARLVVSNISFDEILLKHLFVKNSVYTHDFNGSGQQTQQEFYGEMGCNGTVSLHFSTPLYLWLLENL